MKTILNEIKYQYPTNLPNMLKKFYAELASFSLIIYLILVCIIPIIFLKIRKRSKSKDILDSNKDIKKRKNKSKISNIIIYFCFCKKKKHKDLNRLQLGRLLKEENGFQIIEGNKYKEKESNGDKNNFKDIIAQDKKINSHKEKEINKSIQSSQLQEINLKNPKFQIQNQDNLEFQKINLISQNTGKDNLKKFIDKKNNIKKEKNEINEKMIFNLEITKTKLETQILMITSMESDINQKINTEKFNQINNQIFSNIKKISYFFRLLNNVRKIMVSRKYINQIIKYEVNNNMRLKISKSFFLNDIEGFKYKDYEKKIEIYITKFIVQIGDYILSQNQYNLTIDFLFFLKKFFNAPEHFKSIIKGIKINNIKNNNIIDNLNETYNNKKKMLQQNEHLNLLKPEISYEENKSQNFQKRMNSNYNLKSNQINSISIINNELILDKNINIVKDISRKEILKVENIKHLLEKIIKIKTEIKNIVNTATSDNLESQLTLKLEKNIDLFDIDIDIDIDNINLELNNNMNYLLHEFKNDSINNLNNIFMNYCFEEEKYKSYIKSDNLLKHEKENINSKFSKIMNEIISSENMISSFKEKIHIINCNNTEDLQNKLISIISSIRNDIIDIKDSIKKMNKKIIEYYDILSLSIAFKIKIKQLHKRFLKDKDILTFGELFKYWKNEFLDEYIKDLKKKYSIDEKTLNISTKYKGKVINVEYLKTAKGYKKYIIDTELSQINTELMLMNIDTLIQNMKANIYETDEDIDFSKLPSFLEE